MLNFIVLFFFYYFYVFFCFLKKKKYPLHLHPSSSTILHPWINKEISLQKSFVSIVFGPVVLSSLFLLSSEKENKERKEKMLRKDNKKRKARDKTKDKF